LSAAMRMRWSTYSSFIAQCSASNIQLNRKVLSNIALAFPKVFDSLVAKVSK
jgi:ribosomal protein L20